MKPIRSCGGRHFPDVPKFDCLILAVGDEITVIATAIDKRDPIQMTCQNPCWLFSKATPVPNLMAQSQPQDIVSQAKFG
jgi:hypothetical protein